MSDYLRCSVNKLSRIQFAIEQLRLAQRFGIDSVLERLEEQEAKAHDDLVKAEAEYNKQNE